MHKAVAATNKATELSALLGRFDDIKRATKLPSGHNESDSHHSFSLALIAYSIAAQYCPELDTEKIMKYALAHDLLELVTGDESTLHHTHEAHVAKKLKEEAAAPLFKKQFLHFPEIVKNLEAYEKLDQPESAFVYVMDKTCTIWTHFYDHGVNLRELGIANRADIDVWYAGACQKLDRNLKCEPPKIARDIFHQSFLRMRTELLND